MGPLRCAAYMVQAWLASSAFYLLALLVAGRRPGEAHVSAPPPVAPTSNEGPAGIASPLHLIVLVPAHNEERDIPAAIGDLLRQDYPAHLLTIIVIADNCSDETGERAVAAGAVVWERNAPDAPGKGQALAWAIERLWQDIPDAGAVVIVDADCSSSPNLCSTIAAAIQRGAHAVQVPYVVSNPSASATASLRAAGFTLKHAIRARGRARLGLSCNLFGTGMGFSTALLRRIAWPESVTEDTELFVRLTRAGYRVTYADGARVGSPMPVSADQAAQQQLRWESGNAQLVRQQLPALVWQTIVTGDVQGVGAAAELAVPSQTLMAAGGLVLLAGGVLTSDRRLVATSAATIAGQAVYVVGGLALAGGTGLILQALVHVPGFAAGRLRVLGRVATGRGARTWVRTSRASGSDKMARRG